MSERLFPPGVINHVDADSSRPWYSEQSKQFFRAAPKPDPKMPHPLGGGPTRCTTLPTGAAERKQYPIATGFLDYFPDAVAAVAHLSFVANQQHNAGQPVHWARGKSGDEADTLIRHFLQRGTLDSDGIPHSVKVAWRALALAQKELEGN